MECELEVCIYNHDWHCKLQKVSINSLGMCEACITVYLDKQWLDGERQRQLADLEKQDAGEGLDAPN